MTVEYPRARYPSREIMESALFRILTNTIRGKLDIVNTVTLNTGTASTTISNVRVSSATFIGLTPLTAGAASAGATTYIKSQTNGWFIVAHTNGTTADKTFKYIAIG